MLSPGERFPDWSSCGVVADLPKSVGSDEPTSGWKLYCFLEPSTDPIGVVELKYLSQLRAEFRARGIKAFGVVSDPAALRQYVEGDAEAGTELSLVLLNDSHQSLSRCVGIARPQRASFLVDPTGVVRYVCSYDAAYPRNVFSILSVFDSLYFGPIELALRSYTPPSGSRPS